MNDELFVVADFRLSVDCLHDGLPINVLRVTLTDISSHS